MNAIAVNQGPVPVTIREVSVDRSSQWLAKGWRDVWRAPKISLAYGFSFVVISYLFTFGLFEMEMGAYLVPAIGGFILVAPVLVVGLYEVARRLQEGEVDIGFKAICIICMKNASQVATMGVVMLIFAFFWMVIAIVLFAVFFSGGVPPLEDLAFEMLFTLNGGLFLIVGTGMGAILATGIFTISAISIPLLLDRDNVDVITAIAASYQAVKVNWQTMFGWAALLGVISGVALVTFYVGLAIALPMLAYATWHAYTDIVAPEGE